MAVEQDIKALQGFIDETNDSLEGIEAAFIELENDPGNLEIINQIFRGRSNQLASVGVSCCCMA